jgi:hypothetical protein
VHRLYQGSPTSGTDYETRYYTDGYYGRPKGLDRLLGKSSAPN